jgi:hypothetical protein
MVGGTNAKPTAAARGLGFVWHIDRRQEPAVLASSQQISQSSAQCMEQIALRDVYSILLKSKSSAFCLAARVFICQRSRYHQTPGFKVATACPLTARKRHTGRLATMQHAITSHDFLAFDHKLAFPISESDTTTHTSTTQPVCLTTTRHSQPSPAPPPLFIFCILHHPT